MKKKIICILGMHRSGTSLLSNLINHLDVFWGDSDELLGTDITNPDGFYELKHIISIQDRILEICHSSWDSCNWLQTSLFDNEKIQKYKKLLIKYIQYIYIKHDINLFGFKDPRTSILIPIWKEIFEELNLETLYIWLIRNPAEVANSLLKRDGYKKEYGYCLWDYYNLKIMYDLRGQKGILVYYDDLINHTYEICDKLHSFIFENKKVFEKSKIEGIVKKHYRHSTIQKSSFKDREVTNCIFSLIKNIEHNSLIVFLFGNEIDALYKKYMIQSSNFSLDNEWIIKINKERNIIKKYKCYYNLLLYWFHKESDIEKNIVKYLNNYCPYGIILYGFGTLGKLFFDKMNRKINICYIVDEYLEKTLKNYKGIPIGKIEGCHLYREAAIIVTPIIDYMLIQYNLKEQDIQNDIYSLEEILNLKKYNYFKNN